MADDLLTDEQTARRHQPDPLPAVEALFSLPPDERRIYDLHGAANDDATAVVRRARPVKGWVYALRVHSDYEGPDYEFWLAWEDGDVLHTARKNIGYDSYHWSSSYPDHHSWFMHRVAEGQAVTLLLDNSKVVLFGQLEPFIRQDGALTWAAD